MRADEERSQLSWQGRVFGYTGATGVVQALGAGYFMWDLYMCLRYFSIFGPGMLAHAISAISVFSLGFVSMGSTIRGYLLMSGSVHSSTIMRLHSFYTSCPHLF